MRIMTYNIRGGLGMDDKRSVSRLADAARAMLPDIVCFQEVHRLLPWSGGEDQAQSLANGLRRPCAFFAPVRFGFGGEGLGICAREMISAQTDHALPGKRENRGALEVRLRDMGGLRSLTVLCTHWGLDSGERMEQSAACLEIVKNAPRPLILCGDFNETAYSPALQRLVEGSGLLDAGKESNLPTFPSDNPAKRIDFIFYSPDLRLTWFDVGHTLASDHLPVTADFEKT